MSAFPSPREYMRSRRPEQFSDSSQENDRALDRTMLEFHLGTLNDRRQDGAFETFARRLCEKEICPNLLPHSGSDAGGDSKVDTETYPVSPKLAAAWYVGTPGHPDGERWAFAFSTQKTWRAKVRADVKKIVATGRGYTKIFFASSESIRDKDRSAVEDKLRTKYGVDVRILERQWILDRVFAGKHEALAIDELQMSVRLKPTFRRGPNDTGRQQEMEALEKRIVTAISESQQSAAIVWDAIKVAVLAGQSERPRTQVDGLFERARRLAREVGIPHQEIEALYQRAWTTYWYYEDFATFEHLYSQVEERVRGTDNVHELGRLFTLWTMLNAAVSRKHIEADVARLAERTMTIRSELQRIGSDKTRASAALEARTSLVMVDLAASPSTTTPEVAFERLRDIALAAVGLAGYPLKHLKRMIVDLGDGPALPGYDALYETIVDVTTKHDGDVAGGRLLLRRGAQQFEKGKTYDAIRSLGRALSQLYKYETRHDIVRALVLCGLAYEKVDLLWAARGSIVTAAGLAFQELWSRKQVTLEQAECLKQMKWIELRLGRLPHTLAWHELDRGVRASLAARGVAPKDLADGDQEYDAILGLLFLRAQPETLASLTRLPDRLAELDLNSARIALLYGLGHEQEIAEAIEQQQIGPVTDYFLRWRDIEVDAALPDGPLVLTEPRVTLSATVLGCRILCTVDNRSPCVELAESLLAVVQSLLATAFQDGVAASEPELLVDIRSGEVDGDSPFSFALSDDDSTPHLAITSRSFDAHRMEPEQQAQVKSWLSDLIPHLLARVVVLPDPERTLPKLFGDERASDRAVNFTSSFVSLGSVMGDGDRLSLTSWTQDGPEYQLRRTRRWDALLPAAVASASLPTREVAPDPFARESTAHGDIQVLSPVSTTLWDKAGWNGAAFYVPPVLDGPPGMALMFTERDAALRAFAELRKAFDLADARGRFRVAIIRGVSKAHPTWYRISIGPRTNALEPRPGGFVIVRYRSLTATPPTTENLDRFLQRYERVGKYVLGAAVVTPRNGELESHFENAILMRDLTLRNAWEIGRDDPDMAAIFADDNPMIPPDTANPPVVELIAWKKGEEGPEDRHARMKSHSSPHGRPASRRHWVAHRRTPRSKSGSHLWPRPRPRASWGPSSRPRAGPRLSQVSGDSRAEVTPAAGKLGTNLSATRLIWRQ